MTTRRDKGSGSIYQRDSDQMWVGYARTGDKGKRRYVYAKTKKEVSAKLKALQRSIEDKTLVTAKPETVEQYLTYWLSIRSKQNIKETTQNNYESHVKSLLPYIGDVKLTKLTTDMLQSVFNTLLEVRKTSTVHTLYTVLSMACKDAMKWKRLSANPCTDVQLPPIEKYEGPVLNKKQATTFLEFARGHYLECWLTVALATGLRRGELLALKWADIDMEQKILKVVRTRAVVHDEVGVYRTIETTPKSRAGKRTIKLPLFVVNALKAHRTRQLEQRLQVGAEWIDNDLIFCKANGDLLVICTVSRHFKKLLKQAGLPDMRVHDLRHSSATLLLSMGVDLKTIQEILGHASFATTANIYGHVLMEMQAEAMDKMDSLFLVSR